MFWLAPSLDPALTFFSNIASDWRNMLKKKFSTISLQADKGQNAAEEEDELNETSEINLPAADNPHKLKPLSRKKLEVFRERHDNTGVVYMSRVPPAMKPQKVRHMLSQFGEIGRIYLAAEGMMIGQLLVCPTLTDNHIYVDPKTRERRKRAGGNKKKSFQEGWIEFMDKRVAKTVAATLNNQIMGGKKSNYYHDDIWNLKYLPKFKWIHLNEQLAYERQERQKKLQMETEQAKKEISAYLRNVDQAKMLHAMREKQKRKAESSRTENNVADGGVDGADVAKSNNDSTDADALRGFRRRFKQRKVIDDSSNNIGSDGGSGGLNSTLLNQLLT